MVETTQPSSSTGNVGPVKKGMGSTVGSQFASLLDYLTQLPSVVTPQVSPDVTSFEQTKDMAQIPDWLQQLAEQPDELLSLLKQPELQAMKQEPKKMEQLIVFVKQLLDGNVEQANEQFEQLPPLLQQIVLQTLSNDIVKTKEMDGVSSKHLPLKRMDGVVTALPINQTLLHTSPPSEIVQVDARLSEQTKEKMPFQVSLPSLNRKGMAPVDPEGKGTPVPMSLPLFKGTSQMIRPTAVPIPEQIQHRIEAALQQAPFIKGADGSTRLSIRLYPEQLGEVVVQLDRKEGMLTIKLFASTEQAKQSIEQQLGKLQTILHQQTPVFKIETGMLASSTREFQQSFTRDQQEQEAPYQETPVPLDDEEEEDDD